MCFSSSSWDIVLDRNGKDLFYSLLTQYIVVFMKSISHSCVPFSSLFF